MKIAVQKKVYKVKYGATKFNKKASKKVLRNSDVLNIDSVQVIAENVYDALDKTSKYLLAKEKEYLKDNMQVWVESVELVCALDDLEE